MDGQWFGRVIRATDASVEGSEVMYAAHPGVLRNVVVRFDVNTPEQIASAAVNEYGGVREEERGYLLLGKNVAHLPLTCAYPFFYVLYFYQLVRPYAPFHVFYLVFLLMQWVGEGLGRGGDVPREDLRFAHGVAPFSRPDFTFRRAVEHEPLCCYYAQPPYGSFPIATGYR